MLPSLLGNLPAVFLNPPHDSGPTNDWVLKGLGLVQGVLDLAGLQDHELFISAVVAVCGRLQIITAPV